MCSLPIGCPLRSHPNGAEGECVMRRMLFGRISLQWAALLLAGALAIGSAATAFAQSTPTQTNAPAAPTGLETSANSTTITLTWSAVTGATSYEVKQGASDTWTAVPSASGASYSFGGLTAGLDYTLSVRAKNDGGTSPPTPITASIPTPDDGLSVIAATRDSITVAWSAVADATSYEVKAGADGAITEVTSGRSHEFTGLLPPLNPVMLVLPSWRAPFGHDRTLYVRGKNATQQVFPWRLITARTVGFGGLPTASSTSITITSWSAATGAGEAVKFKLGPSGTAATVLPTRGRGLTGSTHVVFSHTFTGLTPATTYTIAENSGVYTLHASPTGPVAATTVAKQWTRGWGTFTTAPAPPSGLRADPNSDGLTLSWSAVSGATRYDVKLGADGPATTVPSAATSYTFTGLTPSTEYRLYVHARNGGGSSEWKSVPATTLSTLSPPPSSLTVTDATSSSITLSWDAVSGATSYEVRRDGRTATTVTDTSRTFTGLTAFTEYMLSVRGKAGDNTFFPWRSITAKTETVKWESSADPIYVVPTSTSLIVFSQGVGGFDNFRLGENVKPTSSVGPWNPSTIDVSPWTWRAPDHFANRYTFAGLTADAEYTISVPYNRLTGDTADSYTPSSRSITVKTLPAQFSGTRTTSFGRPGVALHGSGTTRISGLGDAAPTRTGGGARAVTSTDHFYSAVMVGEEATEFTYYLRSTVSGSADPPVYQWTPHTATTAPWHPTRLSATATSASLTLRWAVSTGATGYRVKRGESGTPTTVTGASYEFTGLTAGTEYTLYVYAENRGGNSEWNSITASTTTKPPAPSDLSPSATSTTITLSWNAVTGATGYDVKQGASGAETAVPSGASYTFSNLTANTEYTLYVRAKNSGGNSEWNLLSATTAPTQPSGLNAMSSSTGLTLSWNIVDGATGYDVKQGATGAVTAVAAVAPRTIEVGLGTGLTITATVSGVNHVFTGLTANTAYTLYVRARNGGGASEWTSLSATTAPAAPGGLTVAATNTSLTLNWSAVTGATGYEVKQGSSSPSVSVSGTSHTFNDLSAGTTYRLDVRARNGAGFSDWTSLTATTAPAAPSGLGATSTSTTITLTWSAVTGATSYEVKQGESGTETAVSSGTSHTFPNLTANTAYTLYVRAGNSGGESEWASLSPTTAPLPPYVAPGIHGLWRLSPSHVELNWTKAAGATGHEVKLGPDGAVTVVRGGNIFYGWHSFRGLIPNVEYTYYVRAVNRWGASDWVSRTTLGTAPPPAPTGASASADGTDLKLSWTAARPSDTTVYEVKLNAGGAATAADSINGHTFSGLTSGTEYTLYVRAKTGSRVSAWSSTTATAAPAGRTP